MIAKNETKHNWRTKMFKRNMEATSGTNNGGCVTATRLRPITVAATAARNSKTPSLMLRQKDIHKKC
jgi:hypothetical protein